MKTKNNEINNRRLEKLETRLAEEKLNHISSILEYEFGLNSIIEIDSKAKKYSIYIENECEEICFGHTYKADEIISCNVYEQVCILMMALSLCTAPEIMQELYS
jgi:hypothetical protein